MKKVQLDAFVKSSDKEQEMLINEIAASLQDNFVFLANEPRDLFLPFTHRQTGIAFNYIFGGTYQMGLSAEEEANAREITDPIPFTLSDAQPTRTVEVAAFLVSKFPLVNKAVSELLNDWEYDEEDAFTPASLSLENISSLQEITKCRLPYEEEWEYACRATTTSLFVFGDTIPEDDELEKWLSPDYSDTGNLKANRFGLYGLFPGEWCADEFDPVKHPRERVIRGGGAYFYPWQDNEWVMCMSAFRMPSGYIGDPAMASARLVYS